MLIFYKSMVRKIPIHKSVNFLRRSVAELAVKSAVEDSDDVMDRPGSFAYHLISFKFT